LGPLHTSVEGEHESVTLLLERLRAGDAQTLAPLIDVIYPELRKLARVHFRRERPGHVLQPTALVNEAWLRLARHRGHRWQNRHHFYAAASQVMRRILVEHARARKAEKRTAPPSGADGASDTTAFNYDEVMAVDMALDSLERLSPRQARVVELRYFCGLSVPDTAAALDITPRTVDRDWATARAWLRLRLQP
jgi:RNA polymerase sigma factor (TIGR02999 family)